MSDNKLDDDSILAAYRVLKARGLPKPPDVREELWEQAVPVAKVKGLMNVAASAANPEKALMDSLYSPAVQAITEILEDPSEKSSVKLQAAQMVLDRVLGKPKQEVEVSGNFVHELRGQLNELLKSGSSPIEVKNLLDKPGTPLEAFVNAHPPELAIVGRKGIRDKEEK